MKCKPSEVLFLEGTFGPKGECADCYWRTNNWDNSPKAAVKQHVAATGHRVVVTKKTITEFWAPEQEEASDGGDGKVG